MTEDPRTNLVYMRPEKWRVYLYLNIGPNLGNWNEDPPNIGAIDRLATLFPPSKYPKLLNIGGGVGNEALYLTSKGYDVTMITLSRLNVEKAKAKGVNVIEMDMHDLHFPANSFDAAYMSHTYEHCLSWFQMLGELFYVLRDGAVVYVIVPYWGLPTEEPIAKPGPAGPAPVTHTNLVTPEQIIWQFNYWGFKLLGDDSINTQSFWFEKRPGPENPRWGMLHWAYDERCKLDSGEK